MNNKGFDQEKIAELKAEIQKSGKSYKVIESEDNSDDYMNFYFVGKYDGKEVVFDAALYTLRIQHTSEIYEMAEHEAAKRFPEYRAIAYEEDENGDIAPLGDKEEEIGLYMAEVMEELEEEEAVKVQEHVDIDENINFGIGLDIGLNVENVTPEIIQKFIHDFNNDSLELDETYYAFQSEDEEDF
jgi:hypothetical protein